ncbi:hypothetical protein [Acidocella sp.]|nr:hypothetical protein [Acidocella sp.]
MSQVFAAPPARRGDEETEALRAQIALLHERVREREARVREREDTIR